MESKAYCDGAVLSQDCLVLETKRERERVKGEEVKESNYFLERAPLEPGENMWDLTYGERSDWPWADEKTCTGVFPPISQPSGGQRRTPAGHERHFTVFLHGTQITSGWEQKKKFSESNNIYSTQISHILQYRKKILDSLLILYVCPLTKKWSV